MATISIRVDDTLKKDAQELYKDLGVDLTTAITMFLKKSVQTQGIPFTVSRYNPETLQAFYEAENGLTKSFSSVDDLFKDLNDED